MEETVVESWTSLGTNRKHLLKKFGKLAPAFIPLPSLFMAMQDPLYDTLFDEIKKDRALKDKAPLLGDLFIINDETEPKAKKLASYERLLQYFSHRTKWDEELVHYLSDRYMKAR